AALETRRPCILVGCLHPADRWGFQRPMIYRAIRKADFYVANTEFEAHYVISKGAEAGKVAVIGAGVDLDFFMEISPREAKDRLGVKDQPLIGFIGQVAAAKGIHVLLKAMQEVWRVFPKAFLLIAGASTLFVETLEKMIGQLPGSQQKQIIRRYDFSPEDKPWLFAAIDLLAYPSGYESFGISFVEAWACKKPVIGGRRGAVASLTTGGRDSLLIKHQVYRDLAEAIILLLTNPDWAKRLGAAGFQKAADRYNWPEIARRYRALYHQAGSL
ncbi:MAG: glycosyltransferase family 1 protein, partial [Desulfobacteraceae bacterium]